MVEMLDYNIYNNKIDYRINPLAVVLSATIQPVGILTFQNKAFFITTICEVQNRVYYDNTVSSGAGTCLIMTANCDSKTQLCAGVGAIPASISCKDGYFLGNLL